MLSKYLIGFVGVTTVAGGVTATTIALNKKGKESEDNKPNTVKPIGNQESGQQEAIPEQDRASLGSESSPPQTQ